MSIKKPFVCKIPKCQPILRAGRVCPHLERLLPKPSGQSVKTVRMPWRMAKADFQGKQIFPFESKPLTLDDFHKHLFEYGLPPEDIDLLASKFFYMDGWDATVKELGYTSIGAAQYHYKRVMYKLRARVIAGKVPREDDETEDFVD